jgi:F-type H+-transporting ATPase subunit b
MMEINATLLGQMITFIIFVWFTMKFIWPPITKALADRQQKIADGIAAGERGKHELELAQQRATEYLRDAKQQASTIVEHANKQATHIIEEAKERAQQEGKRLIGLAKGEIDQELYRAKKELKTQIAMIAMAGAEKILQSNLNKDSNSALIDKLITEI